MSAWKNARMIAYGFLIGTAGVSILASRDAKKVYTHVTAACKRGGTSLMKTFTEIKENCEDISADADEINAKRAAEDRAREIADARALLQEEEGKAA
ncbi:MAG: DUF6110 family protein [Bulleidia sp.]